MSSDTNAGVLAARAVALKSATTPPTITGVFPMSGPASGGTIVTITGQGLTGAIGVSFGGTDAANIAVASDTQVIAVSPPGTGACKVTVLTSGGRSAISLGARFVYAAPAAAGGCRFV